MAKDEKKQVEESLIDSHKRWETLYTEGGSDPFWSDGVNLELVRNHIIYYRGRLEELNYYPDIYNKEVPPIVDSDYMAGRDEIRKHAEEDLEVYKKDENYQYLLSNMKSISKKEAETIYIGNILGCIHSLAEAISKNDYVSMRRHENPDEFKERLSSCRRSLEELLKGKSADMQFGEEKTGQLCFAF